MELVMPNLGDASVWMSFITLTFLEIVLGIDNIIFITIAANKLPEEERPRATNIGLVLAMVMTYLFESGEYQRNGRLVIPGTYQALEKNPSFTDLFKTTHEVPPGQAEAVSVKLVGVCYSWAVVHIVSYPVTIGVSHIQRAWCRYPIGA